MDLIPAIDIRGGNCVRLFKGDYSKETIFSENPLDVAIQWKEEGATRIHIVDLDGAKDGKLVNNNIIEQIADISNIKIQVGGGIRNLSAVKEYFELGAKFTKWRAVIKISDTMPSDDCIEANMRVLAKYAKIVQQISDLCSASD